MKKIESFTIDHNTLPHCIRIAGTKEHKSVTVTKFDIRLRRPNTRAISTKAMHTLEHMLATTLRSDKAFDKVLIDLSPMGCRTGFYMSVFGKWTVEKITPIVKKTMDTTLKFSGNIPGATKKECGNYRDHNLVLAKKVLCDFYKGMQW